MKIPVLIMSAITNLTQAEVIEVDQADYSDPKLRDFVKRTLDAQRDTHPEHVHVLYNGERRSMFVDEFGTGAFGHEALPVNEAATQVYWAASRYRGDDPAQDPHAARIHGVAVLFPDHHVWS